MGLASADSAEVGVACPGSAVVGLACAGWWAVDAEVGSVEVAGSYGVVLVGVVREWAALRAVRSAAVVSLWRAVEIADQRVATDRAVMRRTAAKREWRVALPFSLWVMGIRPRWLVRIGGLRWR